MPVKDTMDSRRVLEDKKRRLKGRSHQWKKNASKQLYSTPVLPPTVSRAMVDYFFPSASRGSVPTSDCCKELLTVKLTSFFFLPVLCYLFFLTPVAKYSRSF